MIALTHFRDDGGSNEESFAERAERALSALAERPGFLRGQLGRSLDETVDWVLVTEWESVGAYRRALGNFDVRLNATQLLASALDVPSAFEPLFAISDGQATRRASDRT